MTRFSNIFSQLFAISVSRKRQRFGAHLVFADDSGFLLMPNVVKTWAPTHRNSTPMKESGH